MEIGLARVPVTWTRWDVIRTLMPILHSEGFSPPAQRKVNFKVELDYRDPDDRSGTRHLGTGKIIVPIDVAQKFLAFVKLNPIKLDDESGKIKFYRKGPTRDPKLKMVPNTPFIDPRIEEEHQEILWQLDDPQLRVNTVQFGILFRETYTSTDSEPAPPPRSFSIEWEHDAVKKGTAYLRFEYDRKLIRVTTCESATAKDIGQSIIITFDNIQRIMTGYDPKPCTCGPKPCTCDPKPYVCFDTLTPPSFQELDFFFNEKDGIRHKRRKGSVLGHAPVAPYACHLRLVLFNDRLNDILDKFEGMCHTCKISQATIIRCDGPNAIKAHKFGFFVPFRVRKLKKEIAKFSWSVAFQLEALLHNGILHTQDIENLLPTIRRLCGSHTTPKDDGDRYVGLLLRRYAEMLRKRPDSNARESPSQCFERTLREYVQLESKLSKGKFLCSHVTFTPSRILMEGPYAMPSNRIIREYEGYEENFIRVDFSEENGLTYKWERGVDLDTLLEERVGFFLKRGFDLAGRPFQFLAYSNSALRNHSVWFIHPFDHPTKGLVDAEFIRETIGNFKDTRLLRQPSKYAARLGQAFTATDPSVRISREEFEEVEDLGAGDYKHTDGVGTISESLGDAIWEKLNRLDPNVVQPSAYQIRFMGYKGMVGVDPRLDKDGNGIRMRLRPSMKKFENNEERMPEIEIAESFKRPNRCYLNRPLIMFLEDLNVERQRFEELQDEAVADARTIHNSTADFCQILDAHSLGRQYRLSYTLKRLKEQYGLDLHPQNDLPGVDNPFLRQVRQVAMFSVLRDIKHSARIPVPQGYVLVGVADEGPAYVKRGYKDVFTLNEGQIYACVQKSRDEEPVWLHGPCTISKSPVVHPGDIQRVEAIGKPPEDKLCLFAKLKNVVVLPSTGKRSLASMLGGGDLDGDQFSVIMYPQLLPMTWEEPAKYPKEDPYELDRDTKVEDICNFIVEYISSDILGLLSDKLLIIADQSKEGIFDKACLKLARLCSKAVDYQKNGNPVELRKRDLPSNLIREKPDWHRAEVVNWRDSDYYESERALGYLFRALSLEPGETAEQNHDNGNVNGVLLIDPISLAVGPVVEHALGKESDDGDDDDDEDEAEADDTASEDLFRKYVYELSYICSTHTISPKPGAQLHEAEIVVGTILDKCTQKRYRHERMSRMWTHTSTLVADTERQFVDKSLNLDREEWRVGLERAWRAWEFSQRESTNAFGVNSFGLIALGIVLDCLENL